MWVAVGLLAGGALGNLADRIRADAVTDYITDRQLAGLQRRRHRDHRWGRSCLALSPTCARPGAVSEELRIVHLDEDLAVVDKPAGLVVHPAPSHTRADPGR